MENSVMDYFLTCRRSHNRNAVEFKPADMKCLITKVEPSENTNYRCVECEFLVPERNV